MDNSLPTEAPENDRVILQIADLTCPWCYIGRVRLEKAIACVDPERRPAIEHIPFRLNPHFPPEGMNRRDYRTSKFGSWQESQRRDEAVAAAARAEGLSIDFSQIERTPATLAGHCLIGFANETGGRDLAHRVAGSLYRCYFESGQDIGARDVLLEIAAAHDLNLDHSRTAMISADSHRSVIEAEQCWATRGVSGVPAFVLPDGRVLAGAIEAGQLLSYVREIPQANLPRRS